MFELSTGEIDSAALRESMADPGAGGFCVFEGWVRNENDGLEVRQLEYEAYDVLAIKEGNGVIAEALQKYPVLAARVVHRTGLLEIGDCAVWVGVASAHRDEAFRACRYIIDEVKHRLPIWKKEHYVNGDSGWVNCEQCAVHAGEPSCR